MGEEHCKKWIWHGIFHYFHYTQKCIFDLQLDAGIECLLFPTSQIMYCQRLNGPIVFNL